MHFLISQIPAILLSAIFITVIMSTKRATDIFVYSYSGLIGLTSLIGVLLHFSDKKDKIIQVILLLIVTTGLIGFVIVLTELNINMDKALVNIGLFFALIAFVVLAFTNSKRVIDKGETYFMTFLKIGLYAFPPSRELIAGYVKWSKDLKLIETSKQKTLAPETVRAEPVETSIEQQKIDDCIGGFLIAFARNIEDKLQGTDIFDTQNKKHNKVLNEYIEKFNKTTEVTSGEIPPQEYNDFKRFMYKYLEREDVHKFRFIIKG